MLNIIIFSDSIGTGQYISLNYNWAALMSEQLSKDFGEGVIITNSSANGRTTRQALEVMQYEVLSKKPDILIIQFGLNDCNIWGDANGMPRVSAEAFEANLFEMAEKAKVANILKIFLITNHPITKSIIHNKTNYVYNGRVRIASDYTISTLLDIEKIFNRENCSGYLLEDGIHLNKKGHALYFDFIYPKIKKAALGVLYANK